MRKQYSHDLFLPELRKFFPRKLSFFIFRGAAALLLPLPPSSRAYRSKYGMYDCILKNTKEQDEITTILSYIWTEHLQKFATKTMRSRF